MGEDKRFCRLPTTLIFLASAKGQKRLACAYLFANWRFTKNPASENSKKEPFSRDSGANIPC
jgi:hypothetical protein